MTNSNDNLYEPTPPAVGEPDYNPYSQQVETRQDPDYTPKRKWKIAWLPTILFSIGATVALNIILMLF